MFLSKQDVSENCETKNNWFHLKTRFQKRLSRFPPTTILNFLPNIHWVAALPHSTLDAYCFYFVFFIVATMRLLWNSWWKSRKARREAQRATSQENTTTSRREEGNNDTWRWDWSWANECCEGLMSFVIKWLNWVKSIFYVGLIWLM